MLITVHKLLVMLLKSSLVKQKEEKMTHSITEIKAVATVKKLIVELKLSKVAIRCKVLKQLRSGL